MKLKAYVINLDRRTDRFDNFTKNFNHTSFEINRVSAVEGRNLRVSPNSPLSSTEHACWLSHLKVIDMFLESRAEYCLVFEDDAVPSTRSLLELENIISQVIATMKKHTIQFVQLGHISHLYRALSRQGLGHRIVQIGLGIRSRTLKINSSYNLVRGECRAGTHALLLSRGAALTLQGTNNPAMFSADDFYMALAQKSRIDSTNTFRLATVVPTLFHQGSRSGGRVLDSDIAILS